MNPIETTTETSKRKLEVRCTSTSGSQISNSSGNRDQIITPTVYGDKAMIKYVIGAANNIEQQSILKKSANSKIPNTAAASISTPNSVVKAVVRPDASTAVKQSITSAPGECKQQIAHTTTGQSLIKLPTIKNHQGPSEKSPYHTVIRRSLPTIKHKPIQAARQLGKQTTTARGHIIYKAKNGHTTGNYPEMIAPTLLTRPAEPPARKLPTIKDIPIPVTRRLEMRPLSRQNSESSNAEITQISSTVTLTKSAVTSGKQTKSLPSPLVTIEKKGSILASGLYSSRQGKVLYPNKMDSMIGYDVEPETGQKSLLIKQPSPNNTNERTPPRILQQKPRQQSLLKVNSLARLLHTSPRTKRSKSLTAIGAVANKRKRVLRKGRRLSTASEGELLLKKNTEKVSPDTTQNKQQKGLPSAVQTTSTSLLCSEQTLPSSSSSSSVDITPKRGLIPSPDVSASFIKSFQLNTVLEMLSAFNMLSWKDRIGSCKESNIKFHLNEFNLLQIAEKCPPRDRIHTAYEKPIYERESSSNTSDYFDPLYLCRRCNCHGAAIDFLSPEFCSYECFRRDSRKRSKMTISSREKLVRERVKKAKKSDGNDARGALDSALERLIPKRFFTWPSYLSSNDAEPAPIDLFLNPFPCGANLFEIGMKLEAIDPEHNSLFCVCTVVEKKGYRLKLKFDGYDKIHNFWVNADSMDIFPPGWCAKTNRVLQPPKGMNLLTFNWPTYLSKTKSTPAPRALFTHLNSSSSTNPFKAGARLEADDLKNTGKVCVATVADVLDNRVLIHFDGWDESYDYWIDINSPYIHPIGWHEGNTLDLVPPPDWEDDFSWPEYLEYTQCRAAVPRMFSPRYPIEFSTGMKLEIVDKKNPCLIRPATVLCRNDYKILIHLDGWPSELTFWVNDDSPDIHPIGWADETGHDLEPPPGFDRPPADMPCPVKGCRGIGNAKRIDINFHANEDTCPYSTKNWETEPEKPSRLDEVGRFVYTGDATSTQQKPFDEKGIIEISSDEQILQVKKEPDSKAPLTGQQKPQLQNSKHIIPSLPQTIVSYRPLQSYTEEIKLAREYLCDYGPRLRQNYLIWRENGNFNPNAIKKNPLDWTTKETTDYITTKCHPIGNLFQQEDIDGVALLSMHQSDLTDILKIKLGPAVKIYSHILHLRNQVVSRFSSAKPPTDT